MIKLKDILKEIGEASSNPYEFREVQRSSDMATYWFTTEGDKPIKYEVEMTLNKEPEDHTDLSISFGVVNPRTGSVNYKKETNRGELYRVMSTVAKIVKEEIAIQKTKYGAKSVSISFAPVMKNKVDDRRQNLYAAYIKKAFPSAERV